MDSFPYTIKEQLLLFSIKVLIIHKLRFVFCTFYRSRLSYLIRIYYELLLLPFQHPFYR